MNEAVRIGQRGTLTLPAGIRKKYRIQRGDTFYLVDLDGILVLTPMTPVVPELAREIERLRREAGLSLEELLEELRRQRQRIFQERYGDGGTR